MWLKMVICWCLPSTKMLFNNHHGHGNQNEDHVFLVKSYYISVPLYKLFVMCPLYASFWELLGYTYKTKAASSKRKEHVPRQQDSLIHLLRSHTSSPEHGSTPPTEQGASPLKTRSKVDSWAPQVFCGHWFNSYPRSGTATAITLH